MEATLFVALFLLLIAMLFVIGGIKIVPQSKIFVVERFGKFDRTLKPGLNIIVPGLQRVAHRLSILERPLPAANISVITKDNVQVHLSISVFYRVIDPEKAVYRIENVDQAIGVTTSAIIRAACGELEFDDVQSKREFVNAKISSQLAEATKIWGIEITRTEILDVIVDEVIRKQMQQQMSADRERRATVLKAEGEKASAQLLADGLFYTAQKQADAVRVRAEADSYATGLMAKAIADNGQSAIDFDVMKRKIEALQNLASSPNAKVMILPSDVTGVLGGLETITELIRKKAG
jgi:regulator of protease activity HflC (stomatin/prohibitin superfamily)